MNELISLDARRERDRQEGKLLDAEQHLVYWRSRHSRGMFFDVGALLDQRKKEKQPKQMSSDHQTSYDEMIELSEEESDVEASFIMYE